MPLTKEQKIRFDEIKRLLNIPTKERVQSDKKIIEYANKYSDKLNAWIDAHTPTGLPLIYYRKQSAADLGLSPAADSLCQQYSPAYRHSLARLDDMQELALIDYATAKKGNAIFAMFALKNMVSTRWKSDKAIDSDHASKLKKLKPSYIQQLQDEIDEIND